MTAVPPMVLLALASIVFHVRAASPGAAEADVLERPALHGKRVAGAVLLAVTQAGPRLAAVGERGIILLSQDAGRTWQQRPAPVSVSLTGVHFVSPQKGWAVGHSGVVLHTDDGGLTWTRQLDGRRLASADPGAPDRPLFDVHFINPLHGFAVGAYGLFL